MGGLGGAGGELFPGEPFPKPSELTVWSNAEPVAPATTSSALLSGPANILIRTATTESVMTHETMSEMMYAISFLASRAIKPPRRRHKYYRCGLACE